MEDQLRKRLSQYPTPIDVDGLWDEIEPRLPRKKRRVLPFWIWLVAGIALSGSLLLLIPGEDNAPPLTETTEIPPPPSQAEKPAPSSPVDVPTPAPRPSAVATDGTATDVPIPKSAPALKTTRTPKTKAAALKPSTPVMDRETPMIYTEIETTDPEVNTPIPTLNIDVSTKSGDLALPEILIPVIEKNQVSSPFVTIDPAPTDATGELSKEPTVVETNTKSAEEKDPSAKKEATKIFEAETERAAEERRAAEMIAARQAKELATQRRKADKQRALAAKTAAKLAKKSLRVETIQDRALADARKRQQRANEKKEADLVKKAATDLRKRGEATRRIAQRKGEQREANTWKASRTAEVESRKEAEKRRAIEKMEAERAEVLARQRQNNDHNEQLKVNAYARKKAMEARLAARVARKAERELARVRKARKEENPGKIRDQKPAYWTVEPGIALSLPTGSASSDGPGSEKALEGISWQVLAGYHRAGGLSLRTGLVRSRINSKLASEITRDGSQPQEAVIAIIVNPDGSRTNQRGIVQVATTETITSKYYNSVSSTDIPVLIGYRFAGNKWGLMVEAGPSFNLSSGGEAHRYNETGFAVVGGNYFRTKLEGRGFLANFGAAYGLTKKTSLTANLRFQSFGGGGFENPDVTSVSTNYSLLGIQLGYRIRF